MMWFSAASFILALAFPQARETVDIPNWGKIKRSVAMLDHLGQPSGVAVLIDNSGYFMAHSSAVPTGPMLTAVIDGHPIKLELQSTDTETDLVLLKSEGWNKAYGEPVTIAGTDATEGGRVITVTVQGPVYSEVVSNDRIAQTPRLRYTPMSELKLEDRQGKLGGAVAFNDRGQLVGILGAALPASGEVVPPNTLGTSGNSVGNSKAGGGNLGTGQGAQQFGPYGLTVGYALGPVLLDRVVDGFLSPSHKVRHPSIGVFFKSAKVAGASIESVLPGSPAELAGVKVGDIIIEANGAKIFSPIEFAVLLFNQRIGATLKLGAWRGSEKVYYTIKVGVQPDSDQAEMFHRKLDDPR